jgi:CheY-like chemotaxis protein
MALILFIDDDLGSRVLYDKACKILGQRSLLADSGKQGLAIARKCQPNLIVLDLSLPDLDGLHVLTQLRQGNRTAHIPVVIVSAGVSEQDPQVSQAAGAAAYLHKPVGLNALQNAIDNFAV